MKKSLGIYIHIPFCVKRCPYCGFYSNALACDRDGIHKDIDYCYKEVSDHFAFLKDELRLRSKDVSDDHYVDSIYFGGGTPSLSQPSDIKDLIKCINDLFEVDKGTEITLEANPGTVDSAKLSGYLNAGVNRLSIGVQSFDDDILEMLGRIHTAYDAEDAIRCARREGFDNISCDLMFGVPGMSMHTWVDTVTSMLLTHPEHISLYSLQIEEGTRYYEEYKAGNLKPAHDGLDREMYHKAISMMKDSGYLLYEISNASLPGWESRHNSKYWDFSDYLGIGPSASSFYDGARMTDITIGYEDCIKAMVDGDPDPVSCGLFSEYHVNSREDDMSEFCFTALRTKYGIDKKRFYELFGCDLYKAFPDLPSDLREFFDRDEIKEDDEHLHLTDKGFDISNRIMCLFV